MQKELFAAASLAAMPESATQEKTSILDRYRLSLRMDQTIVLMIGLLVIYVLVFSFGVETGKRYSMAELRAERSKRERITDELGRKVMELQQSAALSLDTANHPLKEIVNSSGGSGSTKGVAPSIPGAKPAAVRMPTPPESSIAPSKPEGRYTIQIVTVASKVTAEKELKRLAARGHKAFVIPGGKKLQICVDGFESHAKASNAMRQLKSQRIIPSDAYVRPVTQV